MTRMLFKLAWRTIGLVPNDEHIWRSVNRPDHIYKPGTPRAGELKPSFFRDKRGLSFDLARFSTVEGTRRGHAPTPYPVQSGVVQLTGLMVRQAGTDVEHVPVLTPARNYAHCQFTSVPEQGGLDFLSSNAVHIVRHRFYQ